MSKVTINSFFPTFVLQNILRYLLDNPKVVHKKKVLDLGSGCGATAIAAMMSGAAEVVANDIDPSKILCSKCSAISI